MKRVIGLAMVSMISVGAVAQQKAPTDEEIQAKLTELRAEWEAKIQDELANLPDDVQTAVNEAKQRADEFAAMMKQLKVEAGPNVDPEELRAKIEAGIEENKAEAKARIDAAIAMLEEYRVEAKTQIETAQSEAAEQIEARKTELQEKLAEAEALIEEKRAELKEMLEETRQ
ncbi:MAG: hypothetical protein GF344_00695 [Chitinivibrionales bacterium]|nr:hypothetical protein [Chitinivibrionales bacterium]MBD3355639.1 hypothetical protein [Chitinivibrionales bacterium]